jgi:hypothetical protein
MFEAYSRDILMAPGRSLANMIAGKWAIIWNRALDAAKSYSAIGNFRR